MNLNKIIVLMAGKAEGGSKTSSDLKERFLSLFPSWETMLATILAFLILVTVLTLLVWKPVKKMFAERREYIQNNIDEAKERNNGASDDREKANQELMDARLEAAQIVSDAKVQSENIKALTTDKAKEEANLILADAKSEITMQKAKLESDSKREIIEVALTAAKKILEKEVDSETNRRLVEEYIKTL